MAEQFLSPEPPEGPLSPEPIVNTEQKQSGLMVSRTENCNINPYTSTDQEHTTDEQSQTHNKVIKMVCRVASKVLPTEEHEITGLSKTSNSAPEIAKSVPQPVKVVPITPSVCKTPVMPVFSFKHDIIKTEARNSISQELTGLMVRGRSKEPLIQIPKVERPEKIELDKESEKKVQTFEWDGSNKTHRKNITSPHPQEAALKPTNSSLATQGAKSFALAVNPANMPHPRPSSFPPVVGLIPAHMPLFLSETCGFISEPRTATKTIPHNNAGTLTGKKSSSLSLPSHFISVPKPHLLEIPMSPEPLCSSPGPLSPSAVSTEQPIIIQLEV